LNDSIPIDRLQRDILVRQLESFLAAAPDDEARTPYLALREALDRLAIPPELAARLGAIAEVLLTSGRVRSVYGPGAELSLWSLFQKTPRGREVASSLAGANAAFQRLIGQVVEGLGVVARGPATYALTIKTSEVQLVVRFEPAGIRLENVEVGDS
jgi:hypothetical protein